MAMSATALGKLSTLFSSLHDEVVDINIKWNDFKNLYDPANVELLTATACDFFGKLQHTWWEDIVLHLYRLNAPPKSVGRPNLTLSQIPTVIDDPVVTIAVSGMVATAQSKAAFATDVRHRHIAHRPLQPPLGPAQPPLPRVPFKTMNEAIGSVNALMNYVANLLGQPPSRYSDSIEPLGGVDNLVAHLRRGLESRKSEFRSFAHSSELARS